MEELNHQAGETLERPRNPNGWRNFDEDTFSGMDVDLEFAGLVDWGIEKGKKALYVVIEIIR